MRLPPGSELFTPPSVVDVGSERKLNGSSAWNNGSISTATKCLNGTIVSVACSSQRHELQMMLNVACGTE